MEKQLIPYDKYIVYVYAISTIYAFVPSILIIASMFEESNMASLATPIIALASLIYYIYAVFADTKQINATSRQAPSRWWLIIMPVYLWKRANVLNQPKSAFWSFIGLAFAAIIASIVIIAMTAYLIISDPEFLKQIEAMYLQV